MSWSKHYFKHNNIYCVPTIHGSIDFAQVVRKAFYDIEPDCIAVELPLSIMGAVLQGVRNLPYLSAVTFTDIEGIYHYVPIHPCDSIIESIRLSDEKGTELYFVDADIKGLSAPVLNPPDPYYVSKIGLENYYQLFSTVSSPVQPPGLYLKISEMAYRVSQISSAYNKVLFIYGITLHDFIIELLHDPIKTNYETAERTDVTLQHLHEQSYTDVLGTMPFQCYLYEIARKGLSSYHMGIELPPDTSHRAKDKQLIRELNEKVSEKAELIRSLETQNISFDQYDSMHELIFQSRKLYNREWDDNAPLGKLSIMLKFARNYALVNNDLVPSPYHLAIAGKNTINDDYAWELSRLMQFYPFSENVNSLPSLVTEDHRGVVNHETVEFHPHLPVQSWLVKDIPIKQRPKESKNGDWEKIWNYGFGLVSYPAEDLIIENYFQYLRKKGKAILEKEHTRTVEFTTSILDGLDIKETLRNLHLGKLYVREQQPIRGEMGTVVIIFDSDSSEQKYPFATTWYAEHSNESDLVLYSTPPGVKLVGPGISRAEYGGVLSVFPPKGIPEVWSDFRFDKAKSRPDRLLMAAIFYSEQKYVLYIASQPPKAYLVSLAGRFGRHIIYIPISTLSDTMLKKVRFFHFLSDRRLRTIAARYIRLL